MPTNITPTEHQQASPATQDDPLFEHPPRWVYAREPRRELDFETLDFRWLAHHGEQQTRLAALLETCRDVVDGLKRRLRVKLGRRQ
jgi:hypothetical protein